MTDWNLLTAARTIWQEARGEPLIGQQAVAHVLVNRLRDGRWGTTLAEVCLWHAAFSGWYSPRGNPAVHDPNFAAACRLPDSTPALLDYCGLLTNAQTGPDLTGGATFYFAQSMPSPPSWAATMRKCGIFGHQVFLSDKPAPAAMV